MISTIKFCFGSLSHGTVMNYSYMALKRQSNILSKLMRKGEKKKTTPAPGKFTSELYPNSNEVNNRKLTAINKVYMEHITGAMQTGENSSKLLGLGIEISKVRIGKNRKFIKVYWMSTNKDICMDEIDGILKAVRGELQNEINSLRYIGKMPEIIFVRDLNYERHLEVERLLTTMDFGEDHEQTHPSERFICLDDEEKVLEENPSEMRQDILGLNHAEIKRKIEAAILRSKSVPLPHRNFKEEEYDDRPLIPFDKEIFRKMYRKKYFIRRKKDDPLEHFREDDDEGDNRDNDDDDDYDHDDGNTEQEYMKEDYGYEEYGNDRGGYYGDQGEKLH